MLIINYKNKQWKRHYQYIKIVDNEYNYDYNTTNYKFYNDDENEDLFIEIMMITMMMRSNYFLTDQWGKQLRLLYVSMSWWQ